MQHITSSAGETMLTARYRPDHRVTSRSAISIAHVTSGKSASSVRTVPSARVTESRNGPWQITEGTGSTRVLSDARQPWATNLRELDAYNVIRFQSRCVRTIRSRLARFLATEATLLQMLTSSAPEPNDSPAARFGRRTVPLVRSLSQRHCIRQDC